MTTADGRALLQLVKRTATKSGPNLVLPVGWPPQALLRPVATRLEEQDDREVACLTEWRNRHVHAFQTEFTATIERTRRWLADTVGPDDTRILFMVRGLDGAPVGYMGIAFIKWDSFYAEADAVVRGAPAPPHLMTNALRTLLRWSRAQLSLTDFGVRVRSDNSALRFYERAGFSELKRVPLRKVQGGDVVRWVEDPGVHGEISLVHMRLEGEV